MSSTRWTLMNTIIRVVASIWAFFSNLFYIYSTLMNTVIRVVASIWASFRPYYTHTVRCPKNLSLFTTLLYMYSTLSQKSEPLFDLIIHLQYTVPKIWASFLPYYTYTVHCPKNLSFISTLLYIYSTVHCPKNRLVQKSIHPIEWTFALYTMKS
jgi:hypothetical protein